MNNGIKSFLCEMEGLFHVMLFFYRRPCFPGSVNTGFWTGKSAGQ
jgi:hypothetical protein